MAEPRGHTLLTDMLRVANRAIEAHAAEWPWREIRTLSAERESPVFGVAIYQDDPEVPVDRCAVRLHDGRLELVPGRSEAPIDWRVSVAFLRRVASHPDRYVEEPGELELGWLEDRLGIRD